MAYSHHDEIAQKIAPAIHRMRSRDVRQREARVDQAIDESGGLKAAALLNLPLILIRSAKSTATISTASTTVFGNLIHYTMTFPDVTSRWAATIEAEFRATVSDGTSIDTELVLNGQVIDSTTRSAPSSGGAPFFLSADVFGPTGIIGGGDADFILRVKSDTGGTIAASNGRLKIFATREA